MFDAYYRYSCANHRSGKRCRYHFKCHLRFDTNDPVHALPATSKPFRKFVSYMNIVVENWCQYFEGRIHSTVGSLNCGKVNW